MRAARAPPEDEHYGTGSDTGSGGEDSAPPFFLPFNRAPTIPLLYTGHMVSPGLRALCLLFVTACATSAPMRPIADGATLPTGRCGTSLGSSPFKNPRATHFLIADFYGPPSNEPNFSQTVSERVTQALNTFKEEVLRNPNEIDIDVPEDAIELERLPCFLESHQQANLIAKALDADIVIWGQAFCNPLPAASAAPGSNTTTVGNISAGSGSTIRIGTTEADTSKPYTVCPKATLSRSEETSLRRSNKDRLDLASMGHLDLPTLSATEPFQLAQFAIGLHFFEQKNFWLAARFFEKSAELVMPSERNTTSLDMVLAVAYFHLPDYARSLHYSKRALSQVQICGGALEADILLLMGRTLMAQGDYHYCVSERFEGEASNRGLIDLAVVALALRHPTYEVWSRS